ncbi:MAG: S-layer homology domain-containing protein, partial [Oscillospiraceae bacterium]|nr:S-layer homology domain-containing protein [Oscillospiraceae bacterium]
MKKFLSIVLCLAMLLTLLPMATFAEDPNPFTDVSESDYFYDPVLWAVENGITNGMSATTFAPNANCTRAQVVTFLHRSAGTPEPTMTENPFTDVAESDYFYDAVLWAVENGITNGMSATTFAPNASCTRAQVVTFLWRADGAPAPNSSENPFKDISSGEYFYNAVLWAVEKEITNGISADKFGPNATCTRGQIVTFLYRY